MSEFDPARLLGAISRSGADYVLIGGIAVGMHGFVRTTDDVDMLVPGDAGNRATLAAALDPLLETDRDRARLTTWVERGGNPGRIDTAAGPIDVVEEGNPPLDWPTVLADSELRPTEDAPIRVCGLKTLVALKRLAGRPRDQQDLDELELAHGSLPEVDLPGAGS